MARSTSALKVRPFFKPRPVDPYRRLNRTHPYDIWGTLYRIAAYEKVKDLPAAFYTPEQIAALLFTNWNELSEAQQARVVAVKVSFGIAFLKVGRYISEDYELVRPEPDREWREPTVVNKGTYRVGHRGTFHIEGWSPDQVKMITFSSMDDHWGKWIGRRSFDISKYLANA